MYMRKIPIILAVAITLTAAFGVREIATHDQHQAIPTVSPGTLLDNPQEYEGRTVDVVGYITESDPAASVVADEVSSNPCGPSALEEAVMTDGINCPGTDSRWIDATPLPDDLSNSTPASLVGVYHASKHLLVVTRKPILGTPTGL